MKPGGDLSMKDLNSFTSKRPKRSDLSQLIKNSAAWALSIISDYWWQDSHLLLLMSLGHDGHILDIKLSFI